MKYSSLLLVLCFVFIQKNETQAQLFFEANAGYFSTALLNQNNYGYGEMDYIFTNTPGYGLQVGYSIERKHHFQSGVRILTQGQKYTARFSDILHEKHVELDYISIPLSYKLILGDTDIDKGYMRAFVSIGGYFSILRDANTSWSVAGTGVSFLEFQRSEDGNGTLSLVEDLLNGENDLKDQSDFFESSDIGVSLSFGMRYLTLSGVALNFEIIGGYGFQDVNAEDWRLKNYSGEYAAMNNLWGGVQFGLVYYFPEKFESRSW